MCTTRRAIRLLRGEHTVWYHGWGTPLEGAVCGVNVEGHRETGERDKAARATCISEGVVMPYVVERLAEGAAGSVGSSDELVAWDYVAQFTC